MLSDLMINAAVLISFISIANQIFEKRNIDINSRFVFRLLAGGVCGVLGILLMFYSVHVNQNTLIDFRNIATLLAATIGGGTSAIVSGLVIGFFRVAYFGLNKSSIAGVVMVFLVTAGITIIFRTKKSLARKWVVSIIYTIIVSCLLIYYVFMDDPYRLITIYPYYILGTVLVCFVVYRYLAYLHHMSMLFKKFKEESTKDYLTGLNNVREFDKLFRLVIEKALSNNQKFSLLFIDIDFFKQINDTHGHQAGDRVLKEIGKILRQNCRTNDKISRNGGEEFSILLENATKDKAIEIAERIRKIIEGNEFILPSGRMANVTVSIGISSYPETVKDITQIIERADAALYKAKHAGRNRVVADGQNF
ncbi:MAG TPA: diguanylate cyclase [Ruminiclostridium sp.]|nr:diguanylate cyclase [Ruminiclostridium sp.]